MHVTMAKLGSSSCRTLLLAVLLLASIQAGPAMALVGEVLQVLGHGVGQALDHGAEKIPYMAGDKYFKEVGRKNPAWKDASAGGRKGLKGHKIWCKAQGLVDKHNPGGASGTPPSSFAGDLYKSLPPCWSAPRQPQPQVPAAAAGTGTYTLVPASRYPNDVVGQEELAVPTPVAYAP